MGELETQPKTVHRVYKISDGLRESLKQKREELGLTVRELAFLAVEQLPALVEALAGLGLAADTGAARPIRLPMTDRTLSDLRDASLSTGLPAGLLLKLILARLVAVPPPPPRRRGAANEGGRGRASGRRATAGSGGRR